MPRRDPHDHGRFVDRHASRAVPQDDPLDPEAFPGPLLEVGESAPCEGNVGLVVECYHLPPTRAVRTNPSDEHHDPAEPGPFERPQSRRVGESSTVEPDGHG